MYQTIENWYEPIDCIENIKQYHPEMTRWESAFLCGLLKKYRPKKIVEVGTAEGGTSIVIQKALDLLEINEYQFFSVDLNEQLYCDKSKETGYCYKMACQEGVITDLNHKFLLGKYLPEFVEEIGTDVDFILLDTVHSAPGELLDLLVCIKYIAKNAIIVFHDTALDHITMELNHIYYNRSHYITKMCFDTLVGNKIYSVGNVDPDRVKGYANIAAVQVTDETYEYIDDLISSLSYPWAYMPSEDEKRIYYDAYKRLYGKGVANQFRYMCEIQENSFKHQTVIKNMQQDAFAKMLVMILKSDAPVYLYGTGLRGQKLYRYLNRNGISVAGFIVSDGHKNQKELLGVPIYELSDLDVGSSLELIVIASTYKEVLQNVKNRGMRYYNPDDYIFTQLG